MRHSRLVLLIALLVLAFSCSDISEPRLGYVRVITDYSHFKHFYYRHIILSCPTPGMFVEATISREEDHIYRLSGDLLFWGSETNDSCYTSAYSRNDSCFAIESIGSRVLASEEIDSIKSVFSRIEYSRLEGSKVGKTEDDYSCRWVKMSWDSTLSVESFRGYTNRIYSSYLADVDSLLKSLGVDSSQIIHR